MLTEPRDTAGLVLLGTGKNPDDATNDARSSAAIAKIEQAEQKGQIRRFTGNDYTTDLAKGNLVRPSSAGRVTSSSSRPTTRTSSFLMPEEGAIALVGQHADPAEGAPTPVRRPRRS